VPPLPSPQPYKPVYRFTFILICVTIVGNSIVVVMAQPLYKVQRPPCIYIRDGRGRRERTDCMDIIDYFALERLYRERRRVRKKVYVVAEIAGVKREGKIIKENEGRWLIEFYPYEDNDILMRGGRMYMSIREFDIHPVDRQEFEEYLQALYEEYGDL
jgi:hypothetical protein